MKKLLPFAAASIVILMLLAAVPAMAQKKTDRHKSFIELKDTRDAVNLVSMPWTAYNKAPRKAEGSWVDVLVDEDFEKFTAGTKAQPDTANMLASNYTSIYLDPNLTKDGTQWAGHRVYSAGGAINLWSPHSGDAAWLATPLGDYSGDLTITVKAKCGNCLYYDYDSKGNLTWFVATGASIFIVVRNGGYAVGNIANTDNKNERYSVRMYPNQGWHEITYTVRNYDPNADGFIEIWTDSDILIDDIKVTGKNPYMPAPVVNGVTEFREDGFTIEWQPVRAAFTYYVDLWKKTSTGISGFSEDFENFKEGQWKVEGENFAVVDGEGVDGTRGAALYKGAVLTSPNLESPYATFSFHARMVDPTASSTNSMHGRLYIEGLTEEGKWNPMGMIWAWNLGDKGSTWTNDNWKGAADNKYYALRFFIDESECADNEYVVIDNFSCTFDEPGLELERVWGNPKLDYGEESISTTYARWTGTSYSFHGLDPNAEYYYGVRSFYMGESSTTEIYHAFGAVKPTALEATNVDSRGEFTANWKPVTKKSGYYVNLYGVSHANQAQQMYKLIDEQFQKVDASITTARNFKDALVLTNYEETNLDQYTTLPGWTGRNNCLALGMLGCADAAAEDAWLQMPTIDVSNGQTAYLSFLCYGIVDDYLLMEIEGNTYGVQFQDRGDGLGIINATFEFPVTGKTIAPRFSSYNWKAFIFNDIEVMQDVPAGATIYSWLQKKRVDADATSHDFTDVLDYGFGTYAYDVQSYYIYNGRSAVSLNSNRINVVVDAEMSNVAPLAIDGIGTNPGCAVYYSPDGHRLAAPRKGLNIVRMSNGTTKKVIMR